MRSEVIVVVLAIMLLAAAGAGYLAGNMNGHKITSSFSAASTVTTTTIPSSTETTKFESPFIYLTNDGLCTAGSSYAPCWGSPAYLLNSCPNLLAGPSASYTCEYKMKSIFSPYPVISFNVTLDVVGQNMEPGWASCSVGSAGSESFADCISVINSTAFIVGMPSPPPM